jgi:hypothetical protein
MTNDKPRTRASLLKWRALWQPSMYHGWGITKSYFEGWYFKIVDPAEKYVFAIIPGISYDEAGNSHAFIQVLDGKKCQATYLTFSTDSFQPKEDKFALQLGDNFFSADKLVLNLPELKGTLHLTGLHPWPKMLGAPGVMGWFSFIPFMECYHGVVSVHHTLQGTLEAGGEPIDFNGGVGYTEKDWGTSFPSSWIWTQTNHFSESEPISLMASVARIPWLGRHFIGYIVGFQWQGRLFRFATYTGASMIAALEDRQVTLMFKDRRYRLEIIATPGLGADLRSPISGQMTGKVNESMQASLEVKLFDRDQLLFSGIGKNAGLELAGSVEELLTNKWRR